MSTTDVTQQQNQFQTLNIRKEVEINAPVAITFESILEEIGPGSVLEDGTPFHMKLEPFPGGRWFRDLGNNTGQEYGLADIFITVLNKDLKEFACF